MNAQEYNENIDKTQNLIKDSVSIVDGKPSVQAADAATIFDFVHATFGNVEFNKNIENYPLLKTLTKKKFFNGTHGEIYSTRLEQGNTSPLDTVDYSNLKGIQVPQYEVVNRLLDKNDVKADKENIDNVSYPQPIIIYDTELVNALESKEAVNRLVKNLITTFENIKKLDLQNKYGKVLANEDNHNRIIDTKDDVIEALGDLNLMIRNIAITSENNLGVQKLPAITLKEGETVDVRFYTAIPTNEITVIFNTEFYRKLEVEYVKKYNTKKLDLPTGVSSQILNFGELYTPLEDIDYIVIQKGKFFAGNQYDITTAFRGLQAATYTQSFALQNVFKKYNKFSAIAKTKPVPPSKKG